MVTIENQYFSIPQICMSGQCFRLDPISEDTYELIASDRYLRIKVEKREASDAAGGEKQTDETGRTFLYCSSEEYESFWKRYFDLDTSYESYLAGIDPKDEYLWEAARFGRGIRILKQDVWEMIVTFILSQQNNIPRIKGLIRTISERYGQQKERPDKTVYNAFPSPEELIRASEEELRSLKLGYRSRYICGTARMVMEGEVRLDRLKDMEYPQARAELMKLPGIGGKVADCICLFALHQMDAFPVDTHIQKVLDNVYGGAFPFEKYKGCAGVMQQYIFYYDLNNGVPARYGEQKEEKNNECACSG